MPRSLADRLVDLDGAIFAFRHQGDEWFTCGARFGSVTVDEVSVPLPGPFPPWATTSLSALRDSLPSAIEMAEAALGGLARKNFEEMRPLELDFELVGARLQSAETFDLVFKISATTDQWLDVYGEWVARFSRRTIVDVRRNQV